jgi:O-succinylbenzoic acid--CoA ligase
MTVDTPYHWLSVVAADHPHRPCLVDDAGAVTYREVLDSVDSRADVVRQRLESWDIVPIPARIDIGSIIEILAVQRAGGVPFPYIGHPPTLPVPVAPGAAVCVQTSGSSGVRRIVPLTFANVQASVRASQARLGTTSDDRWLLCLPLNHVGGLSIVWRMLEVGGTVIVAPFDASGATIEQFRPTVASMVPTMVQRLVENNAGALASIALVLVGGATLGQSLWDRCLASGVHLVPTYGLTEAGSQVATVTRGDNDLLTGYVGKPLDAVDVAIVGNDGATLQRGEWGLISIAGAAVFAGYLGEAPREDPFVTNDLGWLDANGSLHVEGRVDDVIVSGGENVSLGRVASVISGISGICDVCVVGVEDRGWGTVGGAMVVSDRGLETLDTMVEEVLQPHERPKRWLVRDTIPRLANGKHDLVAVRQFFEEEIWT